VTEATYDIITPERLDEEIRRRRTFAIISHPDAGKTTLTEKLLLYGGAVELAGAVRAKKNQRHATSDWMELERERGISITSTVLQFPYREYVINLLDTPGHADFSEDTYRTLTAADSAVMVIDAAKGIEERTLKLFQVCRTRGIPIFTFINKLDRPALEPLALLDELERVLGIRSVPMNWPIGDGPTFQGVYEPATHQVHRFDRAGGSGQRVAPEQVMDIGDPHLDVLLGSGPAARLRDDVELLTVAGTTFSREALAAGEQTPVFFGSALTNFGVQLFLDAFVEFAPPPGAHMSTAGPIEPHAPFFSGFVFKIQANMNPQHRDSVAFVRVCSGRFERGMLVDNPRLGKSVRITRPQRFFAQERETIDEAFPGDVIGMINPGSFTIGDTLSAGGMLAYDGIPRFAPEHFAVARNTSPSRHKQFQQGLQQLSEEGAIQILYRHARARSEPVLAAVGRLQFEIVQARLQQEYGVEITLEPLEFRYARWLEGAPEALAELIWGHTLGRAADEAGNPVALFTSDYELRYYAEKYPKLTFREQLV
jgi:peptide chain release factor 3